MSFFARLFGKTVPDEKAIGKQVAKAKEPYAQPEYRRMAMEKLLEWDTQESLRGVLERFAVVVQSPHWDEDEKRWPGPEISRSAIASAFHHDSEGVVSRLEPQYLPRNEISVNPLRLPGLQRQVSSACGVTKASMTRKPA